MRKLILQPPRTCNCFHLVLAKFCIFDTCNFLRFPPAIGKGKSDALKQRSGHAISMPGQLLAKCQKSSNFAPDFKTDGSDMCAVFA